MSPNQPIYSQLLDWAATLTQHHNTKPVDGASYDQPGQTVYTTTRCPIANGGYVEVNLTTAAVQADFSWRAEITIDDTATGTYQHILLQTDDAVVETYGKQVIPMDEPAAVQLLDHLKQLTGTSS
jgi:hypothetical protein